MKCFFIICLNVFVLLGGCAYSPVVAETSARVSGTVSIACIKQTLLNMNEINNVVYSHYNAKEPLELFFFEGKYWGNVYLLYEQKATRIGISLNTYIKISDEYAKETQLFYDKAMIEIRKSCSQN